MTDRPTAPQPESPSLTPAPAALKLGPRATLAAALIQALARASRAFTLYDPSNAVVRQFLEEFKARAEAATRDEDLSVDVAPHELRCEGEVVYKEEDREKSLAFRLYRDGVRRVIFHHHASFDELLQLLQVLAIRFTGIRQAEDDVVTAIRKAELTTVEVVAVEGFSTDDVDLAERYARAAARAHPLGPTFDQPLPRLGAPGPIAYRAVPEETLAPLRAAAGPEALAAGALLLAAELVVRGVQGVLPVEDVAQYCGEVRDFLVAERHVPGLCTLADLVLRQPAGPVRERILRGFADPRMLDALLAVVPAGQGALPPDALRLLPFVSAAALLDHLASGESADRREAILGLVAARLPGDADLVIERLASAPAPVARALAKAIGGRAPDRMSQAAVALLANPDDAIRLDALRAIAVIPAGVDPSKLAPLLAAPSEPLRIAAARALERHGGAANARAFAAALTTRRGYSRDEAAAFGHALGVLNPGAALREFDEWLRPQGGLLSKLRHDEHQDLLRWAAVAGLGALAGEEAEQRLQAFAAATKDEDLKLHCRATLAQRRAGGSPGRSR